MSEERDPRCIQVVPEGMIGERLAEWLTEKGFPAELTMVGQIAAPSGGLGLEEVPPPVLEVRVLNPEHAEPAREALTAQREFLAEIRDRLERRQNRSGTVSALCEECGKSSEWPATEMGTTEVCPHCSAYMDIPDPEDNWDDMDFEGESEETADKPEGS
jgi:hypothetical protein